MTAGGNIVSGLSVEMTVVALCVLGVAVPSLAQTDVPFSAIRLRKPQTDSAKVWKATLAQFSRYRAGVDEVWFSTGICFPKMEEHRANAKRLAEASDEVRAIGILLQTPVPHQCELYQAAAWKVLIGM